jgi:hypothetical protein
MKTRKYSVLLVGAGQLGSRYLQGLSLCKNLLDIAVLDISLKSLQQAELRWREVGGLTSKHEIFFYTELTKCPQQIEIAIIATTADSRPEIVTSVAKHIVVRYWLLEKVLAQNSQGLDQILSQISNSSIAWVNTPRRMLPWHNLIKQHLKMQSPMHLTVTGNIWNLASNSLHFLDMLAWWSKESLVSVNTDQLDANWIKGKREMTWEICGTLTAEFSGGSSAKLISRSTGTLTYFIELIDASGSWNINEVEGTALYSNGIMMNGRLPYQSEMTTTLVDEILDSGNCQLPTLEESIAIHRVLVKAFLRHWQCHVDPTATLVPIT